MHQEAATENNYREYNIFNKQSGQSYVVSYDVNHNEDSCTIKVSRKHISTENGHTLKDFSTITEIPQDAPGFSRGEEWGSQLSN